MAKVKIWMQVLVWMQKLFKFFTGRWGDGLGHTGEKTGSEWIWGISSHEAPHNRQAGPCHHPIIFSLPNFLASGQVLASLNPAKLPIAAVPFPNFLGFLSVAKINCTSPQLLFSTAHFYIALLCFTCHSMSTSLSITDVSKHVPCCLHIRNWGLQSLKLVWSLLSISII